MDKKDRHSTKHKQFNKRELRSHHGTGSYVPPMQKELERRQRQLEEERRRFAIRPVEDRRNAADSLHQSALEEVRARRKTPEMTLGDTHTGQYDSLQANLGRRRHRSKQVLPKKRRRPQERFFRMRSHIVKGIIGFIVLMILLYVFPIPLGTIAVTGNSKLTEEDVITAGHLRTPVNLLRVWPSSLRDALAKDLRVDTVSTSYQFPATLVVNIEARQPVAVVATSFGFATLDKNGQVIQLSPAIADPSVPIISGAKLGNILLGDTISDKGVQSALTYLAALSPTGKKEIAEVNIGTPNDLVAYSTTGIPLRLGSDSQLKEKAKLSEDMVADVEKKNTPVQYIDVNVAAPYVKTE